VLVVLIACFSSVLLCAPEPNESYVNAWKCRSSETFWLLYSAA
jgi:hypothetical protein